MTATAERPPTLLSRLVKAVLLRLYRWKGWTLEGEGSIPQRCVILGAPHTSNWDFVFFLGATHQLGIEPAFMGKHTLFRWPLTRFMFDMGGVPVNRTRGGGLGPALMPSGDYRADLARLAAFYRSVMPDHPRVLAIESSAEGGSNA